MEPLRSVLVDRLVIDLVSHQRLGWQHFETQPYEFRRNPDDLDDPDPPPEESARSSTMLDHPFTIPRLTDDGRKILLTAWERRLAHEDAEDGSITGGRALLAAQVGAFAKSLRDGNPDLYAPHRLRT